MMTKNNSNKKAIRTRMEKTGEVYSVAKRKLSITNNYLVSPWESLNKVIGGFKKGHLYVVASRPSEGKSTFALNLATHFATKRETCLYFNLESNRKELVAQIKASLAEIPVTKILDNQLNTNEITTIDNARKKVNGNLIVYEASNDISIKSVSDAAFSIVGTKAVVIDSLELMKTNISSNSINEIIRDLKNLAITLNIPVIIVSHLNRTNELDNIKPKISMLRNSATAWETDAVILLSKQEENRLHVQVAKNRQGATGEFDLLWRPAIRKLEELTPESIRASLNGIV
jgi:replicative DNA helicase